MNTAYFKYLLTIAESGSISKAAQRLNLKQQYLSHVLKSIENEFNITIFERHSRGLTITEDGYAFLANVRQIDDLLNNMHLQSHYPSARALRDKRITLELHVLPINQPDILNHIIASYQKLYPQVQINYIENHLEDSVPCIMSNPYAISLQIARGSDKLLSDQLPDKIQALRIQPALLSILTSTQEAKSLRQKTMSLQELFDKELLAFAPKGLEEAPVFELLSLFGKPTFSAMSENAVIFLNLLQQGDYYTVGSARIAEKNPAISAIPIRKFENDPLWTVALFQKDMFSDPFIRDFVNLLLHETGHIMI